jgi:hypothetical protein
MVYEIFRLVVGGRDWVPIEAGARREPRPPQPVLDDLLPPELRRQERGGATQVFGEPLLCLAHVTGKRHDLPRDHRRPQRHSDRVGGHEVGLLRVVPIQNNRTPDEPR